MRTFDFAPLYRSVVGFDRLADLLESAATETASTGYPPYNIERTGENEYRIEVAVAGFRPDELNVEVKENLLTVQGRKTANDEARTYLHRGLAERNFERRFQLADYVVVTDANDWGGWRTPGAEYDRDPHKIEFQARLIASAPRLLNIARRLAAIVEETPGAPAELLRMAEDAVKIDQYLKDIPASPEGVEAMEQAPAAE